MGARNRTMPWVKVGKRLINIDNIAHFVLEQEDVVQISMIGDAGSPPLRLEGEEARALKGFIEGGELGEIKSVFISRGQRVEVDESRSNKKRPSRGMKNGRSVPEIVL